MSCKPCITGGETKWYQTEVSVHVIMHRVVLHGVYDIIGHHSRKDSYNNKTHTFSVLINT
jgi:hypothetical protein